MKKCNKKALNSNKIINFTPENFEIDFLTK